MCKERVKKMKSRRKEGGVSPNNVTHAHRKEKNNKKQLLEEENVYLEKQTGPSSKPMASPCCLPSHKSTSTTGNAMGELLKLNTVAPSDPPAV